MDKRNKNKIKVVKFLLFSLFILNILYGISECLSILFELKSDYIYNSEALQGLANLSLAVTIAIVGLAINFLQIESKNKFKYKIKNKIKGYIFQILILVSVIILGYFVSIVCKNKYLITLIYSFLMINVMIYVILDTIKLFSDLFNE